MGSTGDSPVPVGDPPTGREKTTQRQACGGLRKNTPQPSAGPLARRDGRVARATQEHVETRHLMKIALVRRQFSATGGAELYVQRLLGALAQSGHEVHLIAETWPEPPAGIVLHRVPGRGSRAIRAYQFALEAQDELARHQFDCVFSLERGMTQDVYRAGDGIHRVWL